MPITTHHHGTDRTRGVQCNRPGGDGKTAVQDVQPGGCGRNRGR